MSFNDTSDQVLSGGIDNEIKVLSIYWFPKFPWGGGGSIRLHIFWNYAMHQGTAILHVSVFRF